MLRGLVLAWVVVGGLVFSISAGAAPILPAWANPVSAANLETIGMEPTEIVDWTLLQERTNEGSPLAVIFAKATTTAGATTLAQVLATKHSIGIYSYDRKRMRWTPVWERVTAEMEVDFVEGYQITDVNGDGHEDVCVRIRYYGSARVLDYIVKTVENGRVKDMFQERSIYQGSVTAAAGYIVVDQLMPGQSDYEKTEIYSWSRSSHGFEKVKETRKKVAE